MVRNRENKKTISLTSKKSPTPIKMIMKISLPNYQRSMFVFHCRWNKSLRLMLKFKIHKISTLKSLFSKLKVKLLPKTVTVGWHPKALAKVLWVIKLPVLLNRQKTWMMTECSNCLKDLQKLLLCDLKSVVLIRKKCRILCKGSGELQCLGRLTKKRVKGKNQRWA